MDSAELLRWSRAERSNQIDLALGRKLRPLFVCGGNTCRSPMAAAIANTLWPDLFDAESAGTAAWETGANDNAIRVMRSLFSVDISNQRPRMLRDLHLEDYDVVVDLDQFVSADLRQYDYGGQLEEWDVTDPYGGPLSDYEATASALRQRIDELANSY